MRLRAGIKKKCKGHTELFEALIARIEELGGTVKEEKAKLSDKVGESTLPSFLRIPLPKKIPDIGVEDLLTQASMKEERVRPSKLCGTCNKEDHGGSECPVQTRMN